MKFTSSMKTAGELAVRKLSAKAKRFYAETDPLAVYEYHDDEGEARYAVRGSFVEDDLTFDELEELFEAIQDAMDIEILEEEN